MQLQVQPKVFFSLSGGGNEEIFNCASPDLNFVFFINLFFFQ